MTDADKGLLDDADLDRPEVVDGVPGGAAATDGSARPGAAGASEAGESDDDEAVSEPAKVMRIGSMIKLLLEEVRAAGLDEASRQRLREIYEASVAELAEGLSPDLQDELAKLALPFESDTPSEAELRVAKAQLVGWLEGLFHGIQATLFAQQMAARAQLEQMRGQLQAAQGGEGGTDVAPGTYL